MNFSSENVRILRNNESLTELIFGGKVYRPKSKLKELMDMLLGRIFYFFEPLDLYIGEDPVPFLTGSEKFPLTRVNPFPFSIPFGHIGEA